jgi:hypothetical protein
VGDEAHVVCVNGAERGEAVSHDGEEGDEDVVDYVDDVVFAAADVDPACCGWYFVVLSEVISGLTNQEKNPGKAEKGDECCVESNKEPKSCSQLVQFFVLIEKYLRFLTYCPNPFILLLNFDLLECNICLT